MQPWQNMLGGVGGMKKEEVVVMEEEDNHRRILELDTESFFFWSALVSISWYLSIPYPRRNWLVL